MKQYQHHNMLMRLALKYSSTYFLEVEEVYGQCVMKALEAEKLWKKSKGTSKSTWIHHVVEKYLKWWCPKQFRQSNIDAAYAPSSACLAQDPERIAAFREALSRLSDDAKQVLQILFETPIEVVSNLHAPKRMRGALVSKVMTHVGSKNTTRWWKAVMELQTVAQHTL